ncbi:MAG: DNA-binding response regulator [Planctomycetota bacterium]|jgi:DNA-binding NarL/FixJ family response regulator|nr:MAG: DNA-binding response regulator [Planctomycetota bacterium]
MAISVLIVDDHEIVRQGLISLMRDSPIRICGEAATPDEAIRQARKLHPDVVMLDVRLGDRDGLDVIKRIRAAAPGVRVVMLSAFDNPTYVARAVSAGAHDYVLKTASRGDLIAAVTGAAAGAAPSRNGELRKVAVAMAKREPATDSGVPLTPRETQVLRQIAMGLANQEIADALEISVETVKEHVQNLLRKLSVSDRTQAAVWALRHGMG